MTAHLLRTREAIEAFKESYGESYGRVLDGVDRWIGTLPAGVRTDYTKGISQEKVPKMVGMLCCWMWERSTDRQTLDFEHPLADRITIRRYRWYEPDKIEQDNSRYWHRQKEED